MPGEASCSIKLDLIAAADEKLGIGKNGALPWKLKKEMAFFNKMTRRVTSPDKINVVLMGRRTWESIPAKLRPLVGRLNVILSSSTQESSDGVLYFHNLDEAITSLENNHTNIERVWVIGGSNVYKEAMHHPCCHRIYLTQVEGQFDCDTFFPEIPFNFTRLSDHGDESEDVPIYTQQEDDIKYQFRIYEKQASK